MPDPTTRADPMAVSRRPADIVADVTLTTARKIELLKSYKERHCAPGDSREALEADEQMSRLLRRSSGEEG